MDPMTPLRHRLDTSRTAAAGDIPKVELAYPFRTGMTIALGFLLVNGLAGLIVLALLASQQ